MCSLQYVSTHRDQLVSTLTGWSMDKYESLLDYLISWDALSWEEHGDANVVGHPLSKLVRDLLDVIVCKGENACTSFIDAVSAAEKAPSENITCISLPKDHSQLLLYLQCVRPHIVRLIHNHVDVVLQHLLQHGCVSKYEIDFIHLPIYSPSQKARRLLDLFRGKGNESAKCLIEFICRIERGEHFVPDVCSAYQKKLKCTISAQSQFLSTYDGGENFYLENIYTESILELSKGSNVSEHQQSSQSPLELQDIVNAYGVINENADTILILGDAGSGKSTLLQHIHHLWADGKALQNYAFVFPFSCRSLCCLVKQVSLKSLLFEHCCWPDHLQEEIFQFILANPKKVLFTFDGFDEFKFNFTDDNKHCSPMDPTSIENTVFNLVQGNLMKDSVKVVTSRPDAVTVVLRRHVKKELILKGFSEEGMEMFMNKHHSDAEISKKIISLVKANSSIHGLCHIPVFCWIVSKCHKELIIKGCSSPHTMTDMYILTLQHFLLHAAPASKHSENILKKTASSINRLGKLAFWGLCHELYVFSHQQILESNIAEEDLTLGFLVLSKSFSVNVRLPMQHYEFLHITFQCFFAALYITVSDDVSSSSLQHLFSWTTNSTNDSFVQRIPHICVQRCWQKENEIMLQTIEKHNLQITANFVSGLFSQKLYDLLDESWQSKKLPSKCATIKRCLSKGIKKHFKSIPPAVPGEKKAMHAMPQFVWLIKCIYEMQDRKLAKSSVKGLEVDHFKITYCGIGPSECAALAFVLKHLKNPIGIQLDHNSVGDNGIEQLIPCLHLCQALYLRDNNISDKGICNLLEQALHWQHFQKIALFNNKLTDNCTSSFANLLRHKQNFLALRLGNNCITDAGAEILAEGLKENHSIQFLGLVGNNIGSIGGKALAVLLQRNTSLEELCLEENKLQDNDAILLAQSIKKNSTLRTLKLSNNPLGEQGISAFAEALHHNTTITAIWLKGIRFTSDMVQNIGYLDPRLSLDG
ncbi:nucleotide-binding oligomerization domain-containing protein 2 isoform X2 [Xenopus laevis]|uniref:Nucleotide-binding oligomerization domain-containing protein 2 isoform X2 n=1 Tax=Xenopus laevis TaxID=8355 RepID=A0A8J1MWA8_XENLA|nr:nucleotide-binding oligomerization domain-containing protein 2 isoform X2 [Xenopus laevis]